MRQEPTTAQIVAAWSVHLYTAMGLPLAVLAVQALAAGDGPRFFLWSALACFVDATDGFLARRVHVKTVLPHFSGRRLDDIVDYIHFTALPLLALPALGLIPASWSLALTVPLIASAYGFCQEVAKTDDAFVGFPSYWNVFALYFYVLGAGPQTILVTLVVLSALVFVPIHYVYPSRTRLMQRWTVVLGFVWAALLVALMLAPEAGWAKPVAWGSLYYPAYYTVLSLVHHAQVKARGHHGDGDGDVEAPAH